MKRLLTLLAVVALVGAASYGIARLAWPAPAADEDQVAWLTREFQLDATQAAAVRKLHYDYIPVCSDHCALIVAAREKAAERPGDAALQAEVVRLEKVCQEATLAHVRQVASHMAPAQGRRFLSLVEPRILRHDHQAVFGLK
jgi:hypothetical protein